MASENKLAPVLRDTAADKAVAGGQALSSIVDVVAPGVGGFFGLLVGQIIPGQRAERLAEYATRLGRRLRITEGAIESLSDRLEALALALDADQRALFEDGALAAVRATTNERIEQIAKVVADGLTDDDVSAAEQRRLLALLNDLSSEDLVVLMSHTQRWRSDPAWTDANRSALDHVIAAIGMEPRELDRAAARQLRDQRLLSLGVLQPSFWPDGKPRSPDISAVGRYLLRQLNLLEGHQY
jgi:hypothetical protein